MKKYSNQAIFCILGLIVGLAICSPLETGGKFDRKPAPQSYVLLLAETPEAEIFEWRPSLIYPTYPPKLVRSEKEFVLK